jgi:hypothetical protein
MSNLGTYARQSPAALDTNGLDLSFPSTAYHGSGGVIEDHTGGSSWDLSEDNRSYTTTKPATSSRPALGSRLLSTAQQASAGLSRQGSILHSRAKSLASFVPKLNTTSTSDKDKDKAIHYQQPNRIFGDLFKGESAPIRLGIPPSSPTKEKEEVDFVMEYTPSLTAFPGSGPRRRSSAQVNTPQPSAHSQRAGWFSRKSTAPATTSVPASRNAKPRDEILDLDINTALFPNGPADPLSPPAFNELYLNATKLLQRMQVAYKAKVEELASVQPEMDVQKEVVEGAETRAEHLRTQLEIMSQTFEEQNKTLKEMAKQLAEEKLKVQEAHDEAHRTVRLVRKSVDHSPERKVSEHDKDTTPKRKKRTSGGSQGSDSGFESDIDYAESVLSSGAETPMSAPGVSFSPACDAGQEWRPSRLRVGGGADRPVLSRFSSSTTAASGKRMGGENAAWATVESLRHENRELKMAMEEERRRLQECIDFVNARHGDAEREARAYEARLKAVRG